MSFRNRLFIGMALIMAAYIAAILVAYTGLRSTAGSFGEFLDGTGNMRQHYREMYAQGLQMGQALRNITLDPANPRAYTNLDKAREDFQLALDAAKSTASRLGGYDAALNKVSQLVATQAEAQKLVMAALKAGNFEDAKTLINSKETPA